VAALLGDSRKRILEQARVYHTPLTAQTVAAFFAEFRRTVSRLTEMRTPVFLGRPHAG
jgi:predicted ATPase